MKMHSLHELALVAVLFTACTSASVNKVLVERTLDPSAVRRSAMEATLRVMDENPGYVDQFFAIARQHPRTLDRFFYNAAQNLHDPDLAALTAENLVCNPAALREVMVQTLDAARDVPAARTAIAEAIEARSVLASSIIADRPSALDATLRGVVGQATQRSEVRTEFLASMRQNSMALARLIVGDRRTLTKLTRAIFQASGRSLAEILQPALHRSERKNNDDRSSK